MSAHVYTLKIGGEAGFGIMSAGETLGRLATRSGYYTTDYAEYPSIVRGGHNVVQLSICADQVWAPRLHTDFLVALDQNTIDLHLHELAHSDHDADGLRNPDITPWIVLDSEKAMRVAEIPQGVAVIDLPFNRFSREIGHTNMMRNTAAVAAAVTLLNGNLQHLLDMLTDAFKSKGEDVVAKNHAVAQAAADHIAAQYSHLIQPVLTQRETVEEQVIMTANHAVSYGAIAAGLQFASVYPMTPTSNILAILAPHQQKFGFIYRQPEDEIAAINMALGASFAGARSMVATSGGGFCLMAEGLGLAGLTELPIVIIEGMRGAPATGLPTWTEQGDLRFVLHAHQGDFPRIVLAAGDAEEAFHLTMQAFNLADKYQCPVIVLVDKHICEGHTSIPAFNYDEFTFDRGLYSEAQMEDFARYKNAADGISLRSIPGKGNHLIANSDEHDEYGFSHEGAANRITQMDKRMRKIDTCRAQDMQSPQLIGPPNADITLVSWGSNKGAILDALNVLPNVNFLYTQWMHPLPADELKTHLENAKYLINIEGNFSAQFGGLIAEKTGIRILDNLLKYDGRPIYPEEIVRKVRGVR